MGKREGICVHVYEKGENKEKVKTESVIKERELKTETKFVRKSEERKRKKKGRVDIKARERK